MMGLNRILPLLCLLLATSCYSPSTAHRLAYYSFITYEKAATINAWNCSMCKTYHMERPRAFQSGDIQGYSGYCNTSKSIILAFRGSDNIPNWIKNIQANLVNYDKCSKCSVHSGFMQGLNAVKQDMLKHISQLRATYKNAPIEITGHSLGGSLAVLAAVEVKSVYGIVSSVVTFGQPRVGNHEFAIFTTDHLPIDRVIHYGDIVPHLPPGGTGYEHGNTEIWYDKKMETYKRCHGDSISCSNSLSKLALNTDDHSLNYYITLKQTEMTMKEYLYQVLVNDFRFYLEELLGVTHHHLQKESVNLGEE